MSAARKSEAQETIATVAATELAAANGDIRRATERMAQRVRQVPSLRAELTEPLIDTACYDAIRKLLRVNREVIWTAPNYTKGGNGERVVHLAAGNSLLDFPLPAAGFKPLRAATKEEVAESAAFYQRQGDDMLHKARWLAAVAKRVPKGKTVADVLTAAALERMQQEATNAE